ncbi:MAG: shikimate kinase [Phycisphaerae bacterium]
MPSGPRNIILIGMPGVGKSTCGVLLAKATGRGFIDTDVYIQVGTGRGLQEIIDAEGLDAFRKLEEQYILCLDCKNSVVATGGSVVYSPPAMAHLKSAGRVVFLDLPLADIIKRIGDLAIRGIVMAKGQSLSSLYAERLPLYRKYADITIDCQGLNQDQVVGAILARL